MKHLIERIYGPQREISWRCLAAKIELLGWSAIYLAAALTLIALGIVNRFG